MSAELRPNSSWAGVLRYKAQLLHQQIAAMQRLAADSGATPEKLDLACAPCYRLLDEIYAHDAPVARALDTADLLLHLEGEGLTESPRLSLVSSIMGDVRKQVGSMIKTLVSSLDESVELPREIDLGLSSFAFGSLYLGFTVPAPPPGHIELRGDPLFSASREALALLGKVTDHIEEADAYAQICRDFADPKIRDAALSAVGQLAPSGRRGVSSVAIGGRALPDRPWRTLTPQTRLQIRLWLEKPVLGDEVVELTGRVRSIDLDQRRFDLRRVDGGSQPDLRCIYPASFDVAAKKWLDGIVIVRGRVETYHGAARLLQVESVREDAVS
jgi:hypothetical protein